MNPENILREYRRGKTVMMIGCVMILSSLVFRVQDENCYSMWSETVIRPKKTAVVLAERGRVRTRCEIHQVKKQSQSGVG